MKAKLSLLLILLSLFGCNKENLCRNENFCAEVNGKKWFPSQNGDFKASPLTARLLYSDSVLTVRASNGSERIYLSIRDWQGISIKDYFLTDTLSRGYFDNSIGSDEFETDAAHTGMVSITDIDRSRKTVAGRFHFKAFNPVTGKVIDVSNGAFNTTYVEY
ncbi:DUF6252 family protein [uncultured Pontibacter sp.]|uniref:DUF6252 family protein n=1 Tax=uncultured Pontibacter sp. TaxID=453356 RepID=UPI0026189248|nr:DUF6252 family protein [uncultured Pontibacter sp.]